MEIFQSLAEEHRRIARLLEQLLQTQDTDDRTRLLSDLHEELEIHARLEKELLYPALRQGDGVDPMIEESLSEHEAMLSLASAIEGGDQSEQWTSTLEKIKGHLDHHIHEEENQLFPKARTVLPADQQEKLAGQIVERRAEIAGEPRPAGETAEAVRRQAEEFSGRVGNRAGEFARMARERSRAALLEGSRSAAQRTDHFAGALHETGENLGRHGHPTLSQYLIDTADELEELSKRLGQGDLEGMMEQARTTADRNPGALFGGAIVAGFLLTRFLKSSDQQAAEARTGPASRGVSGGATEPGWYRPGQQAQQSSEEEVR